MLKAALLLATSYVAGISLKSLRVYHYACTKCALFHATYHRLLLVVVYAKEESVQTRFDR